MKRNMVNKPKQITCQLCRSEFSAYSFSSHLKFAHGMTSDAYETQFGRFRKVQSTKQGVRKISRVTCNICNDEFSSVGMHTHLRDAHNITVHQYVKTHGEFRVNKLKANAIVSLDDSPVQCLICDDDTKYTERALSFHLAKQHKMDKTAYVLQYIWKSVVPKCACGCGQETKILSYPPYKREFLSGHNAKGELNPRYQQPVSTTTREKMRARAMLRINKQFETNGILDIHTPESIRKRANIQTQKFHDKICAEYNISVLDYDKSYGMYYKVQCNACQLIFEQNHQSYFHCPSCTPKYRSKIELELIDYVKSLDPSTPVIQNDRQVLDGLELDVYVPEKNFAIEFNGLYWHSEQRGKDRKYHLSKLNGCLEKNIDLIHIFEDEWVNYKPIVLSKIAQKIGKFDGQKVYARNCRIEEITFDTASEFLNLYHLQGTDMAKHRLGLYYGDDLISVMTFSRPNASKGVQNTSVKTFELSRYAVKHDVLCVGGASKLLSHFIRTYDPEQIITYADRRWSTEQNNVYTSIGFTLSGTSSPNYWYIQSNTKRLHRFGFTKKKTVEMGGDPNKTEWENMQALGYDRIWDCGHFKYTWTKPA